MTEMMEPPFIASSFDLYLNRITENGLTKITPMRELEIMKSFYAGATEGLNLAASIANHPQKKQLNTIIKEELDHYSKSNREMAQSIGAAVSPTKRA